MDFVHENALVLDFFGSTYNGDHDFREGLLAFLDEFRGGLKDRADLHFGHFGIGNAEAHAAMPHHGVALVQGVGALVELFGGNA